MKSAWRCSLIPLVLVCGFLLARQVHASQLAFNSAPLLSCLSGWVSHDEFGVADFGREKSGRKYTAPERERRVRGSIFALDQLKASALDCANPRKDMIAWVSDRGHGSVELTIISPKNGKDRIRRFRLPREEAMNQHTFKIPDETADCLGSVAGVDMKALSDTMTKGVYIRVAGWPLETKDRTAILSKQKQRWSVAQVHPPKDEAEVKALTSVENPDNDTIAAELLQNLADVMQSLLQNFGLSVVKLPELQDRVRECEAAERKLISTLGELGPKSRAAADNLHFQINTLASVFIAPRKGYMTIKTLQEMIKPGAGDEIANGTTKRTDPATTGPTLRPGERSRLESGPMPRR